MNSQPLEVICPKCGIELMVTDPDLAGREVSCPECGSIFIAEISPLSSDHQKEDDPVSDSTPPCVSEPIAAETTLKQESENKETEEDEGLLFYQSTFCRVGMTLISILLAAILVLLFIQKKGTRKEPVIAEPKTPAVSTEKTSVPPIDPIESVPESKETEPNQEPSGELPISSANQSNKESDPPPIDSAGNLECIGETPASSDIDSDKSGEEEKKDGVLTLEVDSPVATEAGSPEQAESETEKEDEKKEEGEEFDVESGTEETAAISFPAISALSEPIDIQKRLSMSINHIHFEKAELTELVSFSSEFFDVPIEIDWQSFPSPVTILEQCSDLDLNNPTFQNFLDKLKQIFDLEVTILPDRIKMAYPKEKAEKTETVSLKIPDLLTLDSASQEFVNGEEGSDLTSNSADTGNSASAIPYFSETFTPEILESAFGDLVSPCFNETDGSEFHSEIKFRIEENQFILTADPCTIRKAEIFLDRLRSLRHLEGVQGITAEEQIPETLCWENYLMHSNRLTLLHPVPLREILLILERSSGIKFFVDLPELRMQGVDSETPIKLIVSDEPFDLLLREILFPLNLDYLVLTENLIVITSKAKAAAEVGCEIHFYAGSEDEIPLNEAQKLAEEIKKEIAPETWGEEVENPGKIWIDPISHSFLIRQREPVQRKIARFLQNRNEHKQNASN